MGKHRLEGSWFSPATSTVFITRGGDVVCSKRGFVGKSRHDDLQIGTAWDSVHDNKYSEEEIVLLEGML